MSEETHTSLSPLVEHHFTDHERRTSPFAGGVPTTFRVSLSKRALLATPLLTSFAQLPQALPIGWLS